MAEKITKQAADNNESKKDINPSISQNTGSIKAKTHNNDSDSKIVLEKKQINAKCLDEHPFDCREIYESYRKKYSFPEYDEATRYIDFSGIDEEDNFLAELKKKTLEKTKAYLEILEPIVHPDTSIVSMYENRYLNEDDKNKAFVLFKRLMHLLRGAELTLFNEADEENAECIRSFLKCLGEVKHDFRALLSKQRDSWEKEVLTKEDIGYFG